MVRLSLDRIILFHSTVERHWPYQNKMLSEVLWRTSSCRCQLAVFSQIGFFSFSCHLQTILPGSPFQSGYQTVLRYPKAFLEAFFELQFMVTSPTTTSTRVRFYMNIALPHHQPPTTQHHRNLQECQKNIYLSY